MCTWFYADYKYLSCYINKAQQLADSIMNAMSKSKASGNIRPTDMAAVLAPNKQKRLYSYDLGFTHESTLSHLSTAVSKQQTRSRMEGLWFRRCVILRHGTTNGAYRRRSVSITLMNSTRSKEKYVIQPEGAEIICLSRLYRFEEHRGIQVPMFTVLTREAVAPVSIHDRMPLILGKESLSEWIRPNSDPNKIAKIALEMIMEKAADYLSQSQRLCRYKHIN